MKYALVNNQLQEAKPGLTGKCEITGFPVIAKCGTVRNPHWTLIGEHNRDSWWKPETPWHREWKNKFPREWHEVSHLTGNGEEHIADVKTDQGFVIEFQHSHLDPQERLTREAFYQSMVQVVDFHYLTQMIMPNGSLKEIVYDDLNRPIQESIGK